MPRGGRGRARAGGRGRRKLSAVRRDDAEEEPLEDDEPAPTAPKKARISGVEETAAVEAAEKSSGAAAAVPSAPPLRPAAGVSAGVAAATLPATFGGGTDGLPPLAEQPFSERERELVKRYRDIQKFLKQSPFYVRPPRQSEPPPERRRVSRRPRRTQLY